MAEEPEILSEKLQVLLHKAEQDAQNSIYWTPVTSIFPEGVNHALIVRSAFIDLGKRVRVGSTYRTTADLLRSTRFDYVAHEGPMWTEMDTMLKQYLLAGVRAGILEETPGGYFIKALKFFFPIDVDNMSTLLSRCYNDIDLCWEMVIPQPSAWRNKELCFDVDTDLYPKDSKDPALLAQRVMKHLEDIYERVDRQRERQEIAQDKRLVRHAKAAEKEAREVSASSKSR